MRRLPPADLRVGDIVGYPTAHAERWTITKIVRTGTDLHITATAGRHTATLSDRQWRALGAWYAGHR